MKELLLASSLIFGSLHGGDLIDVSPDGTTYHDPYSKQYSPGNSSLNIDSGFSMKKTIAGLSKKKTSDIVIYPTKRN